MGVGVVWLVGRAGGRGEGRKCIVYIVWVWCVYSALFILYGLWVWAWDGWVGVG